MCALLRRYGPLSAMDTITAIHVHHAMLMCSCCMKFDILSQYKYLVALMVLKVYRSLRIQNTKHDSRKNNIPIDGNGNLKTCM